MDLSLSRSILRAVWRVAGRRARPEEAARAPEAYCESMLTNVRLHREIMEAWAEHGARDA